MGNCTAPEQYLGTCCGGGEQKNITQTPKHYNSGQFFRGSQPRNDKHEPSSLAYIQGSSRENLLSQIAADANAIRCVLKIQALYRGYKDRKIIKFKLAHMKMSDKNYGHSLEGNYQNQVVRMTLERVGQFRYNEEDRKAYGSDKSLEFRNEQTIQKKYLKYEGQWIAGTMIREGKGRQTFKDGSMYEGWFKNDSAAGKGRLIHADGDIYEGQWNGDMAHGFGLYKHSDGASYEGQWNQDKQHGEGKEMWPDGSSYSGYYKAGVKSGQGYFLWDDGNSYKGNFKENNIHGQGTYTWKDGRQFHGDWQHNKMHGNGVFTWPDGRQYKGQYVNDHKQGHGVFTWPNSRRYDGGWKLGKMDGQGHYTSEKGKIKIGVWKDGKRIQWLEQGNQGKTDVSDNDMTSPRYQEKVL